MTNEEPVPSTSSVLSAAEKNVKIDTQNNSKKRKGLDIDALWRKKFKDVENQKSPEKPAEEKGQTEPKTGLTDEGTSSKTTATLVGTSSVGASSVETSSIETSSIGASSIGTPSIGASSAGPSPTKTSPESKSKSELETEASPKEIVKTPVTTPSVTSAATSTETTTVTTTSKASKKQQQQTPKPAPPPRSPSPIGRTTRSARRKTEAVRKEMNDLEDVKPNIKLLKKSLPGFQCSNLNDGTVGEVPVNGMLIDPSKITLHHHAQLPDDIFLDDEEDSQDEMDVHGRSGDDSNGGREVYEFDDFRNAVTPNGTYNLYTANQDAAYQYYQPYNTSTMQSSPQDDGPYLPAQSPNSNDDQESTIIQGNQRASPATVNWLFDNYEIAEGSSLPRCQLYDHYRKHCEEHRMDPVNAASFGKLIRSVFQNLKTRRLGTRGNSKYHYYGIRMKENSSLRALQQEPAQPLLHQGVYTPPVQQLPRDAYADTVNQVAAQRYIDSDVPMKRMRKDRSVSSSPSRDFSRSMSPSAELPSQQAFLNHTSAVGVIAPPTQVPVNNSAVAPYSFTENDKMSMGTISLPTVPFPAKSAFILSKPFRNLHISPESLDQALSDYEKMCREVLGHVKSMQFLKIEEAWMDFYSTGKVDSKRSDFANLCTLPEFQDWIIELDLTLYQTIVDCLIPHVLLSELSAGMTQSCRTFGKNIDYYLRKALGEGALSEVFIKKKLQAAKFMQSGLKRYTSLNHLAHAARGVLMKQEQCTQMYNDYLKVDINTVHQQAGWICGCETDLVVQINTAFTTNLKNASPMERWANWLEGIVDQVLAKYRGRPSSEVANVGKQFLLNWSFYTSMIIRDLTLRSAMSFGSFTLIRLLADDYMYYLIESRIAEAAGTQLITVIRQDKEWPTTKNPQECIVPSRKEVHTDLVDQSESS